MRECQNGGPAIRATGRRGNLDRAIDLRRRRTGPSRVAHGGATLLGLRSLRDLRRSPLLLRPGRLELLLPLRLEFRFQLPDSLFKLNDPAPPGGTLLPRPIELTKQPVPPLVILVGERDHVTERRPANVAAVHQVRASMLVIRVKYERHRPPLRELLPMSPIYSRLGEGANSSLETKLLLLIFPSLGPFPSKTSPLLFSTIPATNKVQRAPPAIV